MATHWLKAHSNNSVRARLKITHLGKQNPEFRIQNPEEKKDSICRSGCCLLILTPGFWILNSAFYSSFIIHHSSLLFIGWRYLRRRGVFVPRQSNGAGVAADAAMAGILLPRAAASSPN